MRRARQCSWSGLPVAVWEVDVAKGWWLGPGCARVRLHTAHLPHTSLTDPFTTHISAHTYLHNHTQPIYIYTCTEHICTYILLGIDRGAAQIQDQSTQADNPADRSGQAAARCMKGWRPLANGKSSILIAIDHFLGTSSWISPNYSTGSSIHLRVTLQMKIGPIYIESVCVCARAWSCLLTAFWCIHRELQTDNVCIFLWLAL